MRISAYVCGCVCVYTQQKHRQHADLRFKLIKNQVSEVNQSIKTLREDIQRELSHFSDAVRQFQETTKPKVHPPDSPANSVTVVLFCLFLMVLIYGKETAAGRKVDVSCSDASCLSPSL